MSTSLSRLQSFYGELRAPLLLHALIKREFPGTVALLSDCSADAGLLLSMVAEIDPATPVLCANTGGYPPEAVEYIRRLCAHLLITRVQWVAPDPGPEPVARILDTMGLLALITGATEARLPRIALDENGVFRIHPLSGWSRDERIQALQKRNIPPHPLGIAALPESSAAQKDASPPAADWHL